MLDKPRQMSEKQASSEIAQSRERFEKWAGPYRKETAEPWAVWQAAERDTRERCAQIAEHHPARNGYDPNHTHDCFKLLAERIRGKE